MTRRLAICAVLIFLACAASGKDLALDLPADEPVKVYELGGKSAQMLRPQSAEHRQLGQWLSAHRHGWTPYFATPPGQGILVRTRELNLQFIGKTVLARTHEGLFQISVVPTEYAFLLRRNGA